MFKSSWSGYIKIWSAVRSFINLAGFYYPFFHYQPLDTPRIRTETLHTSYPTTYTTEMVHALNTNSTRSLTRVRLSASNWIGRIYSNYRVYSNSSTLMLKTVHTLSALDKTSLKWFWVSFLFFPPLSLFSLLFDEIPPAWPKLPRVTLQLKRMFYCILMRSHW